MVQPEYHQYHCEISEKCTDTEILTVCESAIGIKPLKILTTLDSIPVGELSRITLVPKPDAVVLKGQIALYRNPSTYLVRIGPSPGKLAIIPWKDDYWFLPIGHPEVRRVVRRLMVP